MASDKPYTFNGYRFLLLDSEDINAFATPGGFILITRGMLECAGDEAMLAAVLAHEIGHVQLDHGVKAIKASRWTDAITKTAVAGVSMTSSEMAAVTTAFGGSINDITQTLVVSGYSKDQEKQADEAAAVILARVGYDPEPIVLMLEEMDRRWNPDARDFAATHPSPEERIRKVRKTVDSLPEPRLSTTPERVDRYNWAFNGVI
jgi:predicted Zn-dependent protease